MPAPLTTANLEDVLITAELATRESRLRDIRAEHAAMLDLAREVTTDASGLLQRLVDLAVELCGAGSAGLSLLESAPSGPGVFRWVAMSGAYRDYVGGTTPEDFSPCGTCLELGSPQLYARPDRCFPYLSAATPPIVEGLVIPLRSFLGPIGTIWIVSHNDDALFSSADVGVMTALGDFTSAALALACARDAAEAANRAKDEFLAVVSHELRSPLTGIVGWSELLLSGRASAADAARAISAIHSNALRQQAMVEDLLDTSRATLGTLRIDENAMDLAEVVRAAVDVTAAAARAGSLLIESAIEGPLPFRGDPARLLQVVGNVLNNAVRFTAPGGRVAVRVHDTPAGVEIAIEDTGIGIDAYVLPVIFDPFRQADASSTRRERGLGLGLSIARQIVELHGGTIDAHSDGIGRGAVFTIRLPATRRMAERPPASRTTPRGDECPLRDLSVLIVDDEADVREVLAGLLEQAGALTTTAASAADAMALLTEHPFDIVLADIGMPKEDGYSLAERVRASEGSAAACTLIAVTAYTGEQVRRRALAAGFDDYFTKPIDTTSLVTALIARTHGTTH